MRGSALNTSINELSYEKFRQDFLFTFGSSQEVKSLLWSFYLADSLTTKFGNLGALRGIVHVADIANETSTALQNTSWLEDGKLSIEMIRNILEFHHYILCLIPQMRRVSSTIDFKPGQQILYFV